MFSSKSHAKQRRGSLGERLTDFNKLHSRNNTNKNVSTKSSSDDNTPFMDSDEDDGIMAKIHWEYLALINIYNPNAKYSLRILAISASLQKRLGSFNKAWTAVSP
jgi:hypothetical protein